MMNMMRIVAGIGALLIPIGVQASEVISGPTTSTTGNYTLSWDQGCSPGSNWYNLYENGAGESLGCATSRSFSGKPDGNYYYELEMCELDVILGEFCIGRAYMGWDHTVTVETGGGGGQTGTGDVTVGDYNGDGLSDLYVSPSVGQPFLLSQVYYGHFQVLGNLTSQQINAYSNWTGTNLRLNELDYDVNGVDDVMVNGIGNLLSGVSDQVVFLSSTGSPVRLLAMDDARKQFLGEVLAWSFNKRYFVDTALQNNWYTVEYQTLYGWWYIVDLPGYTWNNEPLADDPMDGNTTPGICGVTSCAFDVTYGWRFYGGVTVQYYDINTSHFDAHALGLVAAVADMVNAGSGDTTSVDGAMEDVFGQLPCSIPGEIYQIPNPQYPDVYYRDNACVFFVLARYAKALFTPPPPPDRIELRGRPLTPEFFHLEIMHLSVHYHPLDQWISAFPSEGFQSALSGPGGFLQSDLNVPRDKYDATLGLGYVVHTGTPAAKWSEMKTSDSEFSDDALEYCLLPELDRALIGTCHGYNSNSYAVGLVNAVGGYVRDFDYSFVIGPGLPGPNVDVLPGASKPVPAANF